ncbi:hypothetical protein NIES3585_13980 [Nodularia sp. NIES-3585]|nr:hypothetical protein NIES3585_13980 [Nodularia sp. NIES-3585]
MGSGLKPEWCLSLIIRLCLNLLGGSYMLRTVNVVGVVAQRKAPSKLRLFVSTIQGALVSDVTHPTGLTSLKQCMRNWGFYSLEVPKQGFCYQYNSTAAPLFLCTT